MAIRLDRHRNEIRIVERGCTAFERRVVEIPIGRPYGPDVADERAAILLQAGAAALRMKIILVPEAVLLGRRNWLHRRGNVLNVIAVDGDQAVYAFRPKSRDNAR